MGDGRPSNRELLSDQRASSIEQMLEIVTRQTAELQRLATLAADATPSGVEMSPTADDTARRIRENR
jgi:hypothetical protein